MPKFANRAKMTTSTTGTGTITLGSPSGGFQTFAAAGVVTGDVVRYVIEDGLDWEIGLGLYNSSGPTLSRGSLTASSTGSVLSLSGAAVVFIAQAAEDVPEEAWIQQNATYTLANSASTQKLFDAGSTNGTLTITPGIYRYEALIYLTAMSSTTGNAGFSLVGAGTATIGSAFSQSLGIDGPINAAAAASSISWSGVASDIRLVLGGTSTVMVATLKGTFKVTAGGTIIPSITLGAASAAIVQPNSYFAVKRVSANTTNTSYGLWS